MVDILQENNRTMAVFAIYNYNTYDMERTFELCSILPKQAGQLCMPGASSFYGSMNIWSIPNWLEDEVRARDKKCVYCGVEMVQKAPRGSPRKTVATWEHIINDARIITRENIALCCAACNSSKGQKTLAVWLQSTYCVKLGVNEYTVAQIIKDAL